jgi:hypothetical protein
MKKSDIWCEVWFERNIERVAQHSISLKISYWEQIRLTIWCTRPSLGTQVEISKQTWEKSLEKDIWSGIHIRTSWRREITNYYLTINFCRVNTGYEWYWWSNQLSIWFSLTAIVRGGRQWENLNRRKNQTSRRKNQGLVTQSKKSCWAVGWWELV